MNHDESQPRLVLDTNILVAAAYRPQSASGQLIELCIEGARAQAVLSPQLEDEYRFIVSRAIRGVRWDHVWEQFLACAMSVECQPDEHPVAADPDDAKVLATAVAAGALAIATNDHHLLDLHPYQQVNIVRPTEALRRI